MARITKSIQIEAPVEKVFDYFSNPRNVPDIWSGVIEVVDVQEATTGGYNFQWQYKLAGKLFTGVCQIKDFSPNNRYVYESHGGIESVYIVTFLPVSGGTKLYFDVHYTVPFSLFGRIAEILVHGQSEREVEVMLANLKAIVEHQLSALDP